MPTDWIDLLKMGLSALVGWLVEWLRQRRKSARGARKLGAWLLVGLLPLALGASSCQVARCVKGCFTAPPAAPAPSPAPAQSPAPAAPGR